MCCSSVKKNLLACYGYGSWGEKRSQTGMADSEYQGIKPGFRKFPFHRILRGQKMISFNYGVEQKNSLKS